MNPIAALAIGAIEAFASIATRRERGEIDDAEASRLLLDATHAHLARLDGFTLGIAAGDKLIADRIAKLRAEFPPAAPTTTPPVMSPGAAPADR